MGRQSPVSAHKSPSRLRTYHIVMITFFVSKINYNLTIRSFIANALSVDRKSHCLATDDVGCGCSSGTVAMMVS